MSNVNKQLNINRESRKYKNNWGTEKNNRTSYQAYRDTILNYLYYKKGHSSSVSKPLYQSLFERLRNYPEKNAQFYRGILKEIEDIPHKPNSRTYTDFLESLIDLQNKYKNNFSINLTQNNNENNNNNRSLNNLHPSIKNSSDILRRAQISRHNFLEKTKSYKVKLSITKFLMNILKPNNVLTQEKITMLKKILIKYKDDADFKHYITRIHDKYPKIFIKKIL